MSGNIINNLNDTTEGFKFVGKAMQKLSRSFRNSVFGFELTDEEHQIVEEYGRHVQEVADNDPVIQQNLKDSAEKQRKFDEELSELTEKYGAEAHGYDFEGYKVESVELEHELDLDREIVARYEEVNKKKQNHSGFFGVSDKEFEGFNMVSVPEILSYGDMVN